MANPQMLSCDALIICFTSQQEAIRVDSNTPHKPWFKIIQFNFINKASVTFECLQAICRDPEQHWQEKDS